MTPAPALDERALQALEVVVRRAFAIEGGYQELNGILEPVTGEGLYDFIGLSAAPMKTVVETLRARLVATGQGSQVLTELFTRMPGNVELREWVARYCPALLPRVTDAAFEAARTGYEKDRMDRRIWNTETLRAGREIIGQVGFPIRAHYRQSLSDFSNFYLGDGTGGQRFAGRVAEMVALDTWFRSDKAAHMLVIAPMGRGKTSLLVRWVASLDGHAVAFVPISIRFSINSANKFYVILASKLSAILDLPVPPGGNDELAEHCFDLIDRLEGERRAILVVIDGLDEMIGWSIEDFLLRPNRRFVRFLLSARPRVDAPDDASDGGWLEWLRWDRSDTRLLRLDRLALDGVADLVHAAGIPAWTAGIDVVAQLFRMSKGDPLLLRFFTDDLLARQSQGQAIDWRALPHLAAGLGEYLRRWWNAELPVWRREGESFPDLLERLLALLACASGPLRHQDLEELLEVAGQHRGGFAVSRLQRLDRFVVRVEGGYVLGHPRLAEHLRDSLFENGRVVQASRAAFVSWGRAVAKDLAAGRRSEVPPYLLHGLLGHLIECDAPARDFLPLLSIAWVRAWEAAEGGHGGFLVAAREALRWIAARAETNDPLGCWTIGGELVLCSVRESWGFPAELLVACVRRGALTTSQALRRLDSAVAGERVRGLMLLARIVSPDEAAPLLREAFASADQVEGWHSRVRALSTLAATMLPGAERDALEAQIWEALDRAGNLLEFLRGLIDAAPILTGDRAWQLVNWLAGWWQGEAERWDLAHVVLPHVPAEHREAALDFAAALCPDGVLDGSALLALFEYLNEEDRCRLWRRVWEVIRALEDPSKPTRSLAAIRGYADDVTRGLIDTELLKARLDDDPRTGRRLFLAAALPDAISDEELLPTIFWSFDEPVVIDGALEVVRRLLSPSLVACCFERALATANEATRRRVLSGLAPHLDGAQLHEARASAVRFHDHRLATLILTELAAKLAADGGLIRLEIALAGMGKTESEEARQRFIAVLRGQDASRWSTLGRVFVRAEATSPPELSAEFAEAIAEADAEEWTQPCIRDIIRVDGPRFTVDEAEAAFLELTNDDKLTHHNPAGLVVPLSILVRNLPEPRRTETLRYVLDFIAAEESIPPRAEVLRELAPVLSPAELNKLIDNILATMPSHYWRNAEKLADLLPLLDDERRRSLIAEIVEWRGDHYYTRVLSAAALINALRPEERLALHSYLVEQVKSCVADDNPLEIVHCILELPDEEARIFLRLLNRLCVGASRRALLDLVTRNTGRLHQIEGDEGVSWLMTIMSDMFAYFP